MSYARRKPGSPIPSGESYTARVEPVRPDRRIGAHTEKLGGYPGTFPVPLNEPEELSQQRTEREAFEEKIGAYEDLIISIQKKFDDIDELITAQKKGFYIRFDPKLYPRVSSAVQFYTERREDDYIDEDTYALAKSDLEAAATLELERAREAIRTGAEPGTLADSTHGPTPQGGSSSLQQQIDKKRSFNVFLLAFKQILGYLSDWVFALGVIKAALKFFRSGKYKNSAGAKRENLNDMLHKMGIHGYMIKGPDGRWEDLLSRGELDIQNPGDLDTITSHAETLMRYVIGVAQDDEVAVESHIPDATPFLLDRMLLPMKKEFFNVTELTESFIDTESVRNIGRGSAAYIPESVPYNRQAIIITTTVQPLLQEEFLNRLDGNLARILRILQGWYLDPRTYCCLVNALGGISALVPKWLHALRFGLWFAVAQIDLELSGLTKKITNILNLIIQGILGVIVMHLHSFAVGFLSAKEHELMGSILNSSSKIVRCAPFDTLVSEYTRYFRGILSQLRAYVSSLSGKLSISMDYYDNVVSLLEKRQRIRKLLNILDLFIDAWQMGYICNDRGVVSTEQDTLQGDIFTDAAIAGATDVTDAGAVGATSVSEVAHNEDQREEQQTDIFQPVLSKEEMLTFLKTKLELPDAFVEDVGALYDDPSASKGCHAGVSPAALDAYRLQIDRALST